MFTAIHHRTESVHNLGHNLGLNPVHPLAGEAQQRPKASIFSETKAVLEDFRKAKKLRGEGLVSIMFYMFIVAIIILGVVALFFSVQNTQREVATSILQTQLVGAVSKVYGTNRRYGTGDLIPILEGFGALPDSAIVEGENNAATKLQHPFGGPILIIGLTSRYSIAFQELDQDTCSTLASKNVGSTRGRSGIVSIAINGDVQPHPLTHAAINTACDEDDAANTITWVYY